MTHQAFAFNEIHRHTDGGFYRPVGVASFAGDPGNESADGVLEIDHETGVPAGATLVARAKHSENQSAVVVFEPMNGGAWQYRFADGDASHLGELGDLVLYEHLWPFEQSHWARPVAQFASRFAPVGQGALDDAQSAATTEQMQVKISAARSERRQREKEAAQAAAGGSSGARDGV